MIRVVDPEWFVSDPTPDPTFKEVSAPIPDPTPAIGMVWGNIYGTVHNQRRSGNDDIYISVGDYTNVFVT
jgi:hypothetical protein